MVDFINMLKCSCLQISVFHYVNINSFYSFYRHQKVAQKAMRNTGVKILNKFFSKLTL